jgi:hypothetical protein
MTQRNNTKSELVKQIESYNLKTKLEALARHDEQHRPFRHLPKQFSKGILIGNIAIVPKKQDESRFAYVIADMVEARILYEDINLKQSAILVAHYLADGKSVPPHILSLDSEFASRLFEIKNYKRFHRAAVRARDDNKEFVYQNKLTETHRQADAIKHEIQRNFDSTFRTNLAK